VLLDDFAEVLPNFERHFLLAGALIVTVLAGELTGVLVPLVLGEEVVGALEIALLDDLADDVHFRERLLFRGIN